MDICETVLLHVQIMIHEQLWLGAQHEIIYLTIYLLKIICTVTANIPKPSSDISVEAVVFLNTFI